MVNTNIFRHLIFGNVDSADYGIYISGDGVYNAPERDVEFVSVPGRNGDIAIDQGRYNNITVTYPAGTFAKTQEEFREKLSDFRNAVLSQKGYQRLEDTYHPEEFRMAVYTAGLEVDSVAYQQAGEFELTFNCKPQRWLTVGALPISVDSGDVLQNPTVFDSGPLLEVEGYGNIAFNRESIVDIQDMTIGNVNLVDQHSGVGLVGFSQTKRFDRALLNEDDVITVGAVRWNFLMGSPTIEFNGFSYTIASGATLTPVSIDHPDHSPERVNGDMSLKFSTQPFTFGALNELESPIDKTVTFTVTGTTTGNATMTYTAVVHIICGYDYITYSMSCTYNSGYTRREYNYSASKTEAISTVSILGHPVYIDCDIGEAYKIENGIVIPLNGQISFGSDLPSLPPEGTEVTFDNTITDLKITPRWWRI